MWAINFDCLIGWSVCAGGLYRLSAQPFGSALWSRYLKSGKEPCSTHYRHCSASSESSLRCGAKDWEKLEIKDWTSSMVKDAVNNCASEIAGEKLEKEEVLGRHLAVMLIENSKLLQELVGPLAALKISEFLKPRLLEERAKAAAKTIHVLVQDEYSTEYASIEDSTTKLITVTLSSQTEFDQFCANFGGMPIKYIENFEDKEQSNLVYITKFQDLENNGYYLIKPTNDLIAKLKKLEAQVKDHQGSISNREKSLEKTVCAQSFSVNDDSA
jgi:hypothetical protein